MINPTHKLGFIAAIIMLMGFTPLTDPTKPPASLLKAAFVDANQPLVLTATFVSSTKQYAILNSAVVQVGDKVGPFTIISILPNSVELSGSQGNRETVQMTPAIKSPGKGTI